MPTGQQDQTAAAGQGTQPGTDAAEARKPGDRPAPADPRKQVEQLKKELEEYALEEQVKELTKMVSNLGKRVVILEDLMDKVMRGESFSYDQLMAYRRQRAKS